MRSTIGYGATEGLLLSTPIASIAAGATVNTEGTSDEVFIPDDVTAVAFEGLGTASAAAIGENIRFDLQVQMFEGATYQTNPISVRCPLPKKGYNSGPIDPVNLRLGRKMRLGLVQNEASTATVTGVNIRYRLIR